MVLGMIALFRQRLSRQGRFVADDIFGVYVIHSPLVVFISMLLKDWPVYP
jgi:hypothetical protein